MEAENLNLNIKPALQIPLGKWFNISESLPVFNIK